MALPILLSEPTLHYKSYSYRYAVTRSIDHKPLSVLSKNSFNFAVCASTICKNFFAKLIQNECSKMNKIENSKMRPRKTAIVKIYCEEMEHECMLWLFQMCDQ